MLDCITGGRLISGMVRGVGAEYYSFERQSSVLACDASRRRTISSCRAWTRPGPFVFEGKYYHFEYVNVWPRPYQQPHPPIWAPSTGSIETIEWAAHPSRKYVYLQAYSPIQSVVRYLNYYREASQRLLWLRGQFRANRLVRAGLCFRHRREGARRGAPSHRDPVQPPPAAALRDDLPAGVPERQIAARTCAATSSSVSGQEHTVDTLIEQGIILCGSPDTVRKQLMDAHRLLGFQNLLCAAAVRDAAARPHREERFRLFAREVLPGAAERSTDKEYCRPGGPRRPSECRSSSPRRGRSRATESGACSSNCSSTARSSIVTGAAGGIGRATAEALAELGATTGSGRPHPRRRSTRSRRRWRTSGAKSEAVRRRRVEGGGRRPAAPTSCTAEWGRAKAVDQQCRQQLHLADHRPLDREMARADRASTSTASSTCAAPSSRCCCRRRTPRSSTLHRRFGHIGNPQMPVYCAAKGGVISLTRQLAVDYGGKGLRVNSICPGPTLSPRVKGYFDSGKVGSQGDRLQKVMLGAVRRMRRDRQRRGVPGLGRRHLCAWRLDPGRRRPDHSRLVGDWRLSGRPSN